MRAIRAIAWLTFREGLRMRIVLVFLIVLVVLVLTLPAYLRGDETLAGRLQNFLDYTLGPLGVVNVFLSAATVFFACGTLSGEFKQRSLHMVVTKPVTRFQILVGKWLGVNLLSVLILVLCGAAIYGFAYRIRTLPAQFDRDRYKLRDVVWTAREAARPVVPQAELADQARAYVQERIQTGECLPDQQDSVFRGRFAEELRQWRIVRNGYANIYEFENLAPPEQDDAVVQVRFKIVAQPLPLDELADVGWAFRHPETGAPLSEPIFTRERTSQEHQFLVRAAPIVVNGRAVLEVLNPFQPGRRTALLFEGPDSLMILYKVGSFEVNFLKALLILALRLALLSAVGVFFSVFTSFPVACLCTCAFFLISLGMPFWLASLEVQLDGFRPLPDPTATWGERLRTLAAILLKLVFPDFTHYDGAHLLVDGLVISPRLLGACALHTLAYGALLLLGPGWLIFRAREVAEVQI